jgi:hypothetical protein
MAESVYKVIELVGTSGDVAGRLESAAREWDNIIVELHIVEGPSHGARNR